MKYKDDLHIFKINFNNISDRNNERFHAMLALEDSENIEYFIAGGYVRSIFDHTPIEDFDLFFRSQEDADKLIAVYRSKGWNEVFRCPRGELVTMQKRNLKVQFIMKRFYSDAAELIGTFDILACCFAIDLKDSCLYFYRKSLKDAKRKRLCILDTPYPLATINRIYKYKQKGYYFGQEAMLDFIDMLKRTEITEENRRLYID